MKFKLTKKLLLLTSSSLLMLLSCHKTKDTIVKVDIRTSAYGVANQNVGNAKVVLYIKSVSASQSTVRDTLYTNNDGACFFNLSDKYKPGSAGMFVLDVLATKDNLTGSGVIKVEEEKTNSIMIFIK